MKSQAFFLGKVDKIIVENMDDASFGVSTLVKSANVNRIRLYRIIQAHTGKSPSRYIRIHRLNKAAELLQCSHYNVTEVMRRVGFNNHSYFTKCFKELFGQLPSEYGKKKRHFHHL